VDTIEVIAFAILIASVVGFAVWTVWLAFKK
jgi:hypothetical protein